MFHSFLILIIAMLGWIRVGSMPVPSFWSSLTSLAYMSSAGDQHNKFPAQFEYSSQQSSSIFDKSTYMDHVEGRNVRGNVINRAINEIVYDPVPLEDNDLSEHFLSQVTRNNLSTY